MASTDAKAVPTKNVAFRLTVPILDADGDLVSGATGLDSEVSKDGGAFADCTNEATEIGSSGIYTLDLTATEMNADTVAVIVKTTSSGAKTTPVVLYTAARSINDLAFPTTTGRSMDVDAAGGVEVGSFQAGALTAAAFAAGATPIIRTGTAAAGGASTITLDAGASAVDSVYIGNQVAIVSGTGIGQTRMITGYVGATKVATVGAAWTTNPDATSVFVLIPSRSHVSNVSAGAIPNGAFAAGAIDAAAIAADAIGASELAADAVTEIQSGLATAAALATVAGYVDTEVAAILAAVDTEIADIQSRLPAALVGGRIDASIGAAAANTLTASALAADAVTEIATGILASTIGELAAVPGASPAMKDALALLYMALRNKLTTSTTQVKIHDDAGTVVATAAISDAGGTFTRNEFA